MKTICEVRKNMCGGPGEVTIEHVLPAEAFHGNARLYAKVTMESGCGIGYHVHEGESESYYILSGRGIYNDNGATREVCAGDVTNTTNGNGHGITNNGVEPLVMMALVVMD